MMVLTRSKMDTLEDMYVRRDDVSSLIYHQDFLSNIGLAMRGTTVRPLCGWIIASRLSRSSVDFIAAGALTK
jgi:hypothetical protein